MGRNCYLYGWIKTGKKNTWKIQKIAIELYFGSNNNCKYLQFLLLIWNANIYVASAVIKELILVQKVYVYFNLKIEIKS